MKFLTLMFLALVGFNSTASLERLRDVSLVLKFNNGVCSGTAVARNVILSAEHCFAESNLVSINGRDAKSLYIVSDGKDHVLVVVSIEFERWAKFGPSPKQGERVRWIGNPRGEENMYREGYVVRNNAEAVLIDAPGYKGDSGAGVFDEEGRVVAVISGAYVWGTPEGMRMQLAAALPLAFTRVQLDQVRLAAWERPLAETAIRCSITGAWESIKKPLPVVEVPAPIEAHAG